MKIKNPLSSNGVTQEAGHLPVDETVLSRSALQLLEENVPVPDAEGYLQWRSAFERGKAGVFTIPLSECVDVMEAAISQAPPQ